MFVEVGVTDVNTGAVVVERVVEAGVVEVGVVGVVAVVGVEAVERTAEHTYPRSWTY